MNRVRLLPEQVANQIAAGEVIERPASVVKELVENSLDAAATRLLVEIQAGGRSLVRVTDDGSGMSRDDSLLCLERHATSKIRVAEDLAAISTMGFRGEALPSIASVSRFTLTTRERDSESPEGTQVLIAGGRIIEVKAAGAATGTTVEVRQLFFNLPARRKFLRSEETESAHVQHYLTLAALAYPEVALTFLKDGRQVWQLPAIRTGSSATDQSNALGQRLRDLYGDEQRLLRVDFTGTLPGSSESEADGKTDPRLRLWGFIGAPGVSRSTREDQHLFVNKRPVENRGLNFALLEGYHTALMKGRYPVCCLFIELSPAGVDVNIHPAKREVKFHREADVRRLVAEAVRQTLLTFHSVGGTAPSAVLPATAPVVVSSQTVAVSQPALPTFPEPRQELSAPEQQKSLPMGFRPADPPRPAPTGHGTEAPTVSTSPPLPVEASTPLRTQEPVPLLQVPLRLVGVIARLYVVLESDRGLVLLDQHAAHERILFEQMLNRIQVQSQSPSQKLLLPETVELSPRDAMFIRQQLAVLTRLGVGLSEFGERTFLLDALPPFVKVSDPRRFVLELVDELKAAGQQVNSARLGEHTVAKTVCRHAVKANDPLTGQELQRLVENLRQCAMPYTCPHGRPTLIEMSMRELEKKFGRSQ